MRVLFFPCVNTAGGWYDNIKEKKHRKSCILYLRKIYTLITRLSCISNGLIWISSFLEKNKNKLKLVYI